MKAWLVRNRKGSLRFYYDKPRRCCDAWWEGENMYIDTDTTATITPAELAAKVTWEGEPLQVEIEIKEVRNEQRR